MRRQSLAKIKIDNDLVQILKEEFRKKILDILIIIGWVWLFGFYGI